MQAGVLLGVCEEWNGDSAGPSQNFLLTSFTMAALDDDPEWPDIGQVQIAPTYL